MFTESIVIHLRELNILELRCRDLNCNPRSVFNAFRNDICQSWIGQKLTLVHSCSWIIHRFHWLTSTAIMVMLNVACVHLLRIQYMCGVHVSYQVKFVTPVFIWHCTTSIEPSSTCSVYTLSCSYIHWLWLICTMKWWSLCNIPSTAFFLSCGGPVWGRNSQE